jgi:hypothetical protein
VDFIRTEAVSQIHLIQMSLRFALFLDGLDEFGGDLGDLVEFINSMAQNGNTKVCVASRPWIVFFGITRVTTRVVCAYAECSN